MRCVACLCLFLGAVCWSANPYANTLVLVSIDGFRWDFLDLPEASQMSAIASRGTRVTKLRTVYPSKTFPAHLSIATGLYPTGHGVVDNRFCRSDRADCYRMGHGRKDPTWLAGTPLWTLVEQQGGRASTFFWPESDAPFAGTLPTDYRLYDGRVPHGKRVAQVVEWLSLPQGTRPDLVTLYFSAVDSAGHTFGPGSKETRAAIADIDEQIATLWRSIQSLNVNADAQISLLLLSDHGMAEVDPATFIDTNDLPRPQGFKRMNGSTRVTYYQRDPEADLAALASELDELADGRFWRVTPDTLAERHFVDHPAVGQIIVETAPPRVFRHGGGTRADLRGMHGYPDDVEDMAAFLVAVGPGFHSGLVIPEAHQLDVYPVAARLLALRVPVDLASDGGHLVRALREQ